MVCISEQSDDPELLVYSLDFNKPLIEKALEITAEYVSKHRLILTGGTAIDMALRSKGRSIYDENALPDYDIISNNNLQHATALAEILCNNGYKDINVITAVHITTVRVRIKNVVLLDATYLPARLVERIPYLDIGKFRLVHPDYQKIDQWLSLATLMIDTGISLNVFNRFVKDLKRNAILREVFRLDNTEVSPNCKASCGIVPADLKIFTHRISIPLEALELDEQYIEVLNEDCFIYTGPVCCSGFLTYALLYHEFTKTNKPIEGTIDPHVVVTKTSIELDMPVDMPLSFLNCSDNPLETLDKLANYIEPKTKVPTQKFNALANLKPISVSKRYKKYNIEVSDSYGTRFSINQLELSNKKIISTSVYYVLMQFLRDRIYDDTDQMKGTNSLYYESLLKMMLYMQETTTDKLWFPTISCYGYTNLPEYKAFALEKIIDPERTKLYKPKSSYLREPRCMTKSEFDASLSHYFAIDGLENENISHTNLKWVTEAIQEIKPEVTGALMMVGGMDGELKYF